MIGQRETCTTCCRSVHRCVPITCLRRRARCPTINRLPIVATDLGQAWSSMSLNLRVSEHGDSATR